MLREPQEREPHEELARVGLRATQQRLGILRLLRELDGHPTATEVHSALITEQPSVSQKTVYETLDAFVAAGLASRITDGGEPFRYEGRTERHYHARCRICGRLVDVPAVADGQIRGRTQLPEGFEVETIRVTLEGHCLRCRDEI